MEIYAYAIDVGSTLLDFGFNQLNLDKISGSTVSANTGIARLARAAQRFLSSVQEQLGCSIGLARGRVTADERAVEGS